MGKMQKAGWAEPLQTRTEVFLFLVGLSLCKSMKSCDISISLWTIFSFQNSKPHDYFFPVSSPSPSKPQDFSLGPLEGGTSAFTCLKQETKKKTTLLLQGRKNPPGSDNNREVRFCMEGRHVQGETSLGNDGISVGLCRDNDAFWDRIQRGAEESGTGAFLDLPVEPASRREQLRHWYNNHERRCKTFDLKLFCLNAIAIRHPFKAVKALPGIKEKEARDLYSTAVWVSSSQYVENFWMPW